MEQWREDFKTRLSKCEVCRTADCHDLHELVPGYVRQKALDQEYAILGCCRSCHDFLETLTIPHQLAFLLLARPNNFDIERYYCLCGRRWPDIETIKSFASQIKR